MLEVFILRCRNLPSTSKKSVKFPNPYVKVYLCGSKGGRIKRRTDKKLKTQNPVYNELLSFPVVDRQAADWFLHVAVCCKEGFFRQVELLGSTTMLITEDIIQKEHPMWVPLHTSDVLGLIWCFICLCIDRVRHGVVSEISWMLVFTFRGEIILQRYQFLWCRTSFQFVCSQRLRIKLHGLGDSLCVQ